MTNIRRQRNRIAAFPGDLLLILLLVCGPLAGTASTETIEPAPDQGRSAKLVANSLPVMHLSREPCDDRIAAAALDIFLSALDYEHCYFLASDVAAFKAEASSLDDEIEAGDVKFAFKVYDIFKQRVANRVAFTVSLLGRGFDLKSHETYVWKRKDAPWPATEAAWNELWRKKIKNEFIARVVADKLGTNSTADVAASDGEDENQPGTSADEKLSPEDSLRKSYKQYLTNLNDNDSTWLVERYLSSFTQAYDPHSDYLSASGVEDFEISMKLSLVGIGAKLGNEDGAAKVVELIPGGPAERDGRLKPNDKIIAVAQGDEEPVDVMHWPLNKTVRLIRGEKNTKVVLSVIPASDNTGATVERIDLVRDEVKLEEQAAKGKLHEVRDGKGLAHAVGVITLPEFYADMKGVDTKGEEARSASRDVKKILADFKDHGAEGVVLDLRNNGGGSLSEAIQMTGLFIDSGPVVQVKDLNSVHIYNDPSSDTVFSGPMLVLVNRLSASASEILAGALQDYGRAVIVGDSKTHGKGTVQSMEYLRRSTPDLGSLKVTTANFYRIDGGSTQLHGVAPDIIIPSVLDTMDVGEEYLPHALAWSAVDPAHYRPVADVKEMVPDLKNLSKARCENDPRFVAYHQLIDRVAERQHSNEITLNLKDRLALAKQDRELQDLLKKVDATGDADSAGKDDLIMDESMQILADMIDVNDREQAAKASEPVKPPS